MIMFGVKGMPNTVVSQAQIYNQIDSAVKLASYSAILGYPECPLMGVNHDTEDVACGTIWLKIERDRIKRYLWEAQLEVEKQIGFRLSKRWETGERHKYRAPLQTDWSFFIAGGVEATSEIASGEAVDHTDDPATVGPVATTVTDADEIVVYHPGTTIQIVPSEIDLDTGAGQVTIYIPRCRMVKQSVAQNDRGGLSYSGTGANFEAAVDIYRRYNDQSTQAELVYPFGKTTCGCSAETSTACIVGLDADEGEVAIVRADYSGGEWDSCNLSCGSCGCQPSRVNLNYYSGVEADEQMQDAIIRLAHSKMPVEPCACDLIKSVWQRDRNMPRYVTRERANCPFGTSDGAWTAWQFTNAFMDKFIGIL